MTQRAYIRLLPDVYARKVLGRSKRGVKYTPGQFAAFIGMLCAAEAMQPRGRFQSKAVLKGMLAGDLGQGVAKHVEFLVAQGDLVPLADGTFYVEGWDELQEGRDPSVNVRMARYRDRQRNSEPVTRNRSVTVPLSAVGRRP